MCSTKRKGIYQKRGRRSIQEIGELTQENREGKLGKQQQNGRLGKARQQAQRVMGPGLSRVKKGMGMAVSTCKMN